MMCYRDRAFCNFYACKKTTCDRRWTHEHHEDAKKWWNNGEGSYPVCFYSDKPKCFVSTEKGNNNE